MAKKGHPRRGQLALLSRDEHDVLALDDGTKAVGRRGVSEVRATLAATARSRFANADRASDGTSTSTIHEEVSARAATYASAEALAREESRP